jgi:hypothetical protein
MSWKTYWRHWYFDLMYHPRRRGGCEICVMPPILPTLQRLSQRSFLEESDPSHIELVEASREFLRKARAYRRYLDGLCGRR